MNNLIGSKPLQPLPWPDVPIPSSIFRSGNQNKILVVEVYEQNPFFNQTYAYWIYIYIYIHMLYTQFKSLDFY